MDVVVVGGGIVGVASAFYLEEHGVDVTVFERDRLGAGSTERAVGGIRAQYSTPVNVELSLASMAVWETFEEEFGVDIAYRRNGYLFLTREEETAEAFEKNVTMQRERGVESRTLTPAAAREHCPGLDPSPFVAATYSPTDGYADPHLALQGYAEAARAAGVEVRTGTAVTDVRGDGGTVDGIEVDGGPPGGELVDADVVVNAAGAWAGRLAAMAGIDVPITPERRQTAVVDPERPVPEDDPLVIDMDTTSHFRPEREGRALVGGQFSPATAVDPDRYDRGMETDWAVEAVERAAEYADYFGPETRLRRGWAGLYAVTPDHHPVIDEVCPGFVVAAGFSGHGFQHAPASGRLVAELAVDREASLVDVEPLANDRFERDGGIIERNVV
jgi:sarcosine oxidase subunit beta